MSDEPVLTRALNELAEAPGPAEMATAALTGARRRRRAQWGLSGLAAFALAGVIAAPFLLAPQASPSLQAAAPPPASKAATVPNTAQDDCVPATSVSPTEKRVLEENWPEFVRVVIAKLPSRTDYMMQSGHGLCRGSEPLRGAYAVINLGPLREHGHLTVNIDEVAAPNALANCAAVLQHISQEKSANPEAPKPELLFCDEATGTAPLVYAIRFYAALTVTAAYDNVNVWMESHPGDPSQQYEIGPEALRAVVTDPRLAVLN